METDITITEAFRQKFNDKKILAALFTTFNFEAEFFDREIVSLFHGDNTYSDDAAIKLEQVSFLQNRNTIPIEVFYDQKMAENTVNFTSPSLNYFHHGIRHKNAIFHAKLTFLLVEDQNNLHGNKPNKTLWLSAGSANLTAAGWLSNIEGMHWIEVKDKSAKRVFLNRLLQDLSWLEKCRGKAGDYEYSALNLIKEYLGGLTGSNSAKDVHYYGLARAVRFPKFVNDFVDEKNKELGSLTHVDIISPYFADSDTFDGHKLFLDNENTKINIFLPFEGEPENGKALCSEKYYEKIKGLENVRWATWRGDVKNKLYPNPNSNFRKLHAKIYLLYWGDKACWAFIGSVNFTHKAFNDNFEAGFFIELDPETKLLTPLDTDLKPSGFDSENHDEVAETDSSTRLDVHLYYDWDTKCLWASMPEKAPEEEPCVFLRLSNQETHKLDLTSAKIDKLIIADADTNSKLNKRIKEHLQSSGFVELSMGESSRSQYVLVQQLNWVYKPSNYSKLTAQQIIEIYAGLSNFNICDSIRETLEREAQEKGLLLELPPIGRASENNKTFFSVFTEIFYAFRRLQTKLTDALEEGEQGTRDIDYYLGSQPDSLPTLRKMLEPTQDAIEEQADADVVMPYISALSLKETYGVLMAGLKLPCHERFQGRINAEIEELRKVTERLREKLKHELGKDGDDFVSWYEEQFLRVQVGGDGAKSDQS